MLSGCGVWGADQEPVPAPVPAPVVVSSLSAEDKRPCDDPGVQPGVDMRDIIADHRVALGECRQRHQRVVKQYQAIQGTYEQGVAEPNKRDPPS